MLKKISNRYSRHHPIKPQNQHPSLANLHIQENIPNPTDNPSPHVVYNPYQELPKSLDRVKIFKFKRHAQRIDLLRHQIYTELDHVRSGTRDFQTYMKQNHVKKHPRRKRIIWEQDPENIPASSEVLQLIDANSDPEDPTPPNTSLAKQSELILPKHKLTRSEELFWNAWDFVKQSKIKKGIDLLREILKSEDENLKVIYNLGSCY